MTNNNDGKRTWAAVTISAIVFPCALIAYAPQSPAVNVLGTIPAAAIAGFFGLSSPTIRSTNKQP